MSRCILYFSQRKVMDVDKGHCKINLSLHNNQHDLSITGWGVLSVELNQTVCYKSTYKSQGANGLMNKMGLTLSAYQRLTYM